MKASSAAAIVLVVALAFASRARSAEPRPEETPISFEEVLLLAAQRAPDVKVARERERVAEAEVGIAGTYPNPSIIGASSTQSAKLSLGISTPLIILGQIGAAQRASRADLATVKEDSSVTVNETRTSAALAFVRLWLAERTAAARADAALVQQKLEAAVLGRIDVGASPEVEGLRVKAERLRADADAREAAQLVDAAGSELGRWLGIADGHALRSKGEPTVPPEAPPLASLLGKIADNPSAKREELDAFASEQHASRERALVRPALTLDVGADAFDPTLCNGTPNCTPPVNYRAQLTVEVPLFNQRGSYIDREQASANVARARAEAERARLTSELASAYRTFEAVSARRKAIEEGVVPAAEAAANATEDSYALGHAPLIAVLDAERARIDARLSLLEAMADRANAWVAVLRALGWR